MSQDIKYTSDGKKVIVVGKLNAQQTIVQEIFVSDGNEIPSGENFVVTSLHDKPAESWKEKNLRELEERYNKSKSSWDNRSQEMERKMSFALEKAKYKADALMAFSKNSDDSQLATLKAFLAGEITHLYFKCSYSPDIKPWDSDAVYDVDSWYGNIKTDGLKLISLYGKSDGSLSYRLHQYRDGSGSSSKEIIPFSRYEDALAAAQQHCDECVKSYLESDRDSFYLENWLKIPGIVIPDEAKEKYESRKNMATQTRIKQLQDEIQKLSDSIASQNTFAI